ncbi:MAG: hypothetical protein H7257_05750 [Taibaiella sp.]|nr:hypothetical protein [Taibaiella sp.]
MAKNQLITLHALGEEIGKIGFDEDRAAATWEFLAAENNVPDEIIGRIRLGLNVMK